MKKMLFLGIVAGVAALIAVQWDDIQRYKRIRDM